jgi:glutathione S-transferase
MPTVYGASASPFVRKVRIFLAEKGIPYDLEEIIPVNVSPEFKKISPLGKIPAYRDGDVTLSDSSVICAYLERTHPAPALYPTDPYQYARALWFEEYGDGGMTPVVGPKIFFQKVVGPRFFNQATDEAMVKKAVEEELPVFYDYLEAQIGPKNVLAGDQFSIGDIGVCTQFVTLQHVKVGVDTKRWPKLARYVASVLERPSFRGVLERERALLGLS